MNVKDYNKGYEKGVQDALKPTTKPQPDTSRPPLKRKMRVDMAGVPRDTFENTPPDTSNQCDHHPPIKCECGDMIADLHFCPKCKRGNLGNRKMVVVGEFTPQHPIDPTPPCDLEKETKHSVEIIKGIAERMDPTPPQDLSEMTPEEVKKSLWIILGFCEVSEEHAETIWKWVQVLLHQAGERGKQWGIKKATDTMILTLRDEMSGEELLAKTLEELK